MLYKFSYASYIGNNAVRRGGEQQLDGIEGQPGFCILLLQLLGRLSSSTSPEDSFVAQSGAVLFKNIVKRRWVHEETLAIIQESDRVSVKTYLVDLMCTSPPAVQKQLAEAGDCRIFSKIPPS